MMMKTRVQYMVHIDRARLFQTVSAKFSVQFEEETFVGILQHNRSVAWVVRLRAVT